MEPEEGLGQVFGGHVAVRHPAPQHAHGRVFVQAPGDAHASAGREPLEARVLPRRGAAAMTAPDWRRTLAAVWRPRSVGLRPVRRLDPVSLNDLLGIEAQKAALEKHAEAREREVLTRTRTRTRTRLRGRAEQLLTKFKWGPTFLFLNRELFTAYGRCANSAEVVLAQNECIARWESER